jgi:hypothetical protein
MILLMQDLGANLIVVADCRAMGKMVNYATAERRFVTASGPHRYLIEPLKEDLGRQPQSM